MKKHNSPIKIKVLIERRSDGGIRASSEDLPGFVLSHKDGKGLLKDVPHVIQGILSDQLCSNVTVDLLVSLGSASSEETKILNSLVKGGIEQEYVALCA